MATNLATCDSKSDLTQNEIEKKEVQQSPTKESSVDGSADIKDENLKFINKFMKNVPRDPDEPPQIDDLRNRRIVSKQSLYKEVVGVDEIYPQIPVKPVPPVEEVKKKPAVLPPPVPAPTLEQQLQGAQPVKTSKAELMMLKMGWNGGPLGKTGRGIVEPIVPNLAYAHNTQGLGQNPPKLETEPKPPLVPKIPVAPKVQIVPKKVKPPPSPTAKSIARASAKLQRQLASNRKKQEKVYFKVNILQTILEFVKNEKEVELLFDCQLHCEQRKFVHHVVQAVREPDQLDSLKLQLVGRQQMHLFSTIERQNRYVLRTESVGIHPNRFLCIYKEAPPFMYLVTHLDFRDGPKIVRQVHVPQLNAKERRRMQRELAAKAALEKLNAKILSEVIKSEQPKEPDKETDGNDKATGEEIDGDLAKNKIDAEKNSEEIFDSAENTAEEVEITEKLDVVVKEEKDVEETCDIVDESGNLSEEVTNNNIPLETSKSSKSIKPDEFDEQTTDDISDNDSAFDDNSFKMDVEGDIDTSIKEENLVANEGINSENQNGNSVDNIDIKTENNSGNFVENVDIKVEHSNAFVEALERSKSVTKEDFPILSDFEEDSKMKIKIEVTNDQDFERDSTSDDRDGYSKDDEDKETGNVLDSAIEEKDSKLDTNEEEDASSVPSESYVKFQDRKMSIRMKLKRFFNEFVQNEKKIEFKFLGNFEGDDFEVVNEFMKKARSYIDGDTVNDDVIDVMKESRCQFIVKEDCNGGTVIRKNLIEL